MLRGHVLVMSFLGHDGWPAPLLKDAKIGADRACELYSDACEIIRRLYWDCRLVHADLSEFNLLFLQNRLYIIDVSQSVEHDHPHALEFLRKDCGNINEYFRKQGVHTLTLKSLFEFVTDSGLESPAARLRQLLADAENVPEAELIIEEEQFKQLYIPKKMAEIDPEKPTQIAECGHVIGLESAEEKKEKKNLLKNRKKAKKIRLRLVFLRIPKWTRISSMGRGPSTRPWTKKRPENRR